MATNLYTYKKFRLLVLPVCFSTHTNQFVVVVLKFPDSLIKLKGPLSFYNKGTRINT